MIRQRVAKFFGWRLPLTIAVVLLALVSASLGAYLGFLRGHPEVRLMFTFAGATFFILLFALLGTRRGWPIIATAIGWLLGAGYVLMLEWQFPRWWFSMKSVFDDKNVIVTLAWTGVGAAVLAVMSFLAKRTLRRMPSRPIWRAAWGVAKPMMIAGARLPLSCWEPKSRCTPRQAPFWVG